MPKIERLTAGQAQAVLPELVTLLQDAVNNGASVNFLPPLSPEVAANYWRRVIMELSEGVRALLVALEDGLVVGSVQLAFATQPNAPHRAEVQKLLVHSSLRKQGIGALLIKSVEDVAQQAGRTLLVLDTLRGSDAERLYRNNGYIEVGVIPNYVYTAKGILEDTVFFYRQLQALTEC